MDRRKLLATAVNGTGLVIASVVAVPGFISAISPAFEKRPRQNWQSLGSIASFPENSVTSVMVAGKGVFVRRETDAVVVFSRACTDLGCPLAWDQGSEWFYCPCHGGVFSEEGEPVAGPPNRPLWCYQSRIRGGELEIDLRSVPPMT